ncbi:hypothetical protein HanLR1_Chr00c0975g0786061 [Helianthus annuus]|nr:hypothetical protein HanLR1_Chr00c0975g0786061 [Helianthus annuus]
MFIGTIGLLICILVGVMYQHSTSNRSNLKLSRKQKMQKRSNKNCLKWKMLPSPGQRKQNEDNMLYFF